MLSVPLFGALALLAWLRGSWDTVRNWHHLGLIFAAAVGMLCSIVIYLLILTNLDTWPLGLFEWAAELGGRVAGGQFTRTQFLAPSSIFASGATAVSPIHDFLLRHAGWAVLFNLPTIINFSLAYLIVYIAFMGITLNVCLTILEFHFSLLCSTVLIPWAPLAGTAFLAEFAIAWLAGTIVRMFIQVAVVGVSVPLFELLAVSTTTGGDPLWWESVGLVGGAVFFFVLSWLVPNRATGIAARGMALGIGGDAVMAGFSNAARGFRGFVGGTAAIVVGATRLIRAQRGTP